MKGACMIKCAHGYMRIERATFCVLLSRGVRPSGPMRQRRSLKKMAMYETAMARLVETMKDDIMRTKDFQAEKSTAGARVELGSDNPDRSLTYWYSILPPG